MPRKTDYLSKHNELRRRNGQLPLFPMKGSMKRGAKLTNRKAAQGTSGLKKLRDTSAALANGGYPLSRSQKYGK
ncbi:MULTISPECIES: hypothetical protein [unclassified Ruegeria]|uniref:hypothetical protein n=1 Tax=unclassified Ruegeria TaxID=2625375 RepID=UPI001480903C|nr:MULTISPECIES: hypothetical protein [unclassified Ruegeria]